MCEIKDVFKAKNLIEVSVPLCVAFPSPSKDPVFQRPHGPLPVPLGTPPPLMSSPPTGKGAEPPPLTDMLSRPP